MKEKMFEGGKNYLMPGKFGTMKMKHHDLTQRVPRDVFIIREWRFFWNTKYSNTPYRYQPDECEAIVDLAGFYLYCCPMEFHLAEEDRQTRLKSTSDLNVNNAVHR